MKKPAFRYFGCWCHLKLINPLNVALTIKLAGKQKLFPFAPEIPSRSELRIKGNARRYIMAGLEKEGIQGAINAYALPSLNRARIANVDEDVRNRWTMSRLSPGQSTVVVHIIDSKIPLVRELESFGEWRGRI